MSNYRPSGPAGATSRSRDTRLPEGRYQDRGQYSADRRTWNTESGNSNRDQRRDDYRYSAGRSSNDVSSSPYLPISQRPRYNNDSSSRTERVHPYSVNSHDRHTDNTSNISGTHEYQRRSSQHGNDNGRPGVSKQTELQGGNGQDVNRASKESHNMRYVRFP